MLQVGVKREPSTSTNSLLDTSSWASAAKAALKDGWKLILAHPGSYKPFGTQGQLHSQVGQDWLVASLLNCKWNGYFVDLAANDAMALSNSLMLERDFDWDGVCIEANAQYHVGLSRRRCHQVFAAVGSPTNTLVKFTSRGVFGGIIGNATDNHNGGRGRVETFYLVALTDILRMVNAPSVIDYLSLDVEGAESMVMKDFAWDNYTISVLTVERPKPELRRMLRQNGYEFLRRNSHFGDETWVHQSTLNHEEKQRYSNLAREGRAESGCIGGKWPKSLLP